MGYDPNEARDKDGKWTSGKDSGFVATVKNKITSKTIKANHGRFGKVEILSMDKNFFEAKLPDGTIQKLPIAYTNLTDENGNKITDFSSLPETIKNELPIVKKTDEDIKKEFEEWKNSKPVELIHVDFVKETDKAVAVEASSHNFNHNNKLQSDTKLVWIPKSMLKDGKIPKWYLDNKVNELTTNEKGVWKTYHI